MEAGIPLPRWACDVSQFISMVFGSNIEELVGLRRDRSEGRPCNSYNPYKLPLQILAADAVCKLPLDRCGLRPGALFVQRSSVERSVAEPLESDKSTVSESGFARRATIFRR